MKGEVVAFDKHVKISESDSHVEQYAVINNSRRNMALIGDSRRTER